MTEWTPQALATRLRGTGEEILSNVGFRVTGESAVAFGALLVNAAKALEQQSSDCGGCRDLREVLLAYEHMDGPEWNEMRKAAIAALQAPTARGDAQEIHHFDPGARAAASEDKRG